MTPGLKDLTTEERLLLLNGLPLFSQAFWGPSGEWCREMAQAGPSGELEKLGSLAGEIDAARKMAAYMAHAGNSDDLCEDLESAYVRLFVSAKGGITASLHHSFYESEKGQLMGRAAQMMAARLKASGLTFYENAGVPSDHLALEIEYLTLLLQSALRDGDEDFLSQVRDFARLEMRPWVKQFSKRLEPETDCPFYPASAALLLGLVSLIAV